MHGRSDNYHIGNAADHISYDPDNFICYGTDNCIGYDTDNGAVHQDDIGYDTDNNIGNGSNRCDYQRRRMGDLCR